MGVAGLVRGFDGGHDVIKRHAKAWRHVAAAEIADRGPGLPDAQIPYLLRPFTRMDTARTHANGAGLGLAIVDRVVQRHHGQLEIKNRETGGLAVRVWLSAG